MTYSFGHRVVANLVHFRAGKALLTIRHSMLSKKSKPQLP